MKTATVRDLRNDYKSLLRWVSAGEKVIITQKGLVVAQLVPVDPEKPSTAHWAGSPEVKRDRHQETQLTAEQSASLIAEAGGNGNLW